MGNVRRKEELRQRLSGHTTSEVRELIDEVIFSERDRAMLKRSVIDDVTYEALAEELDLSVTAVKKHVQRGRNVLIRYL